jgi:O-antigen/teichoic acid export membrane protein
VLMAMARSLPPAAFGQVAIALSLVQMCTSIVEGLFIDSLAQRRQISPQELSGAHTVSVLLGLAMASALAGWGLWQRQAHRLPLQPQAPAMLALLMAPSVLLSSITAVPLATLRRQLALREVALLAGTARIGAGMVAVALLAAGAGAWGVVAHQNLSALALLAALVWRGHGLPPRGPIAPARELLGFATVNSLHGLLAGNRTRLFQLMCSMVMPARVIGQLALAMRLVEMLAAMVITGVARVALVRLSSLAHEGRNTALEYLELTRRFSVLATPVFVLVAALAAPLVVLLGNEGWQDASRLMAWFALAQALRAPEYLASALFSAHGIPRLNVFIVLVEMAGLALLLALLRDPMAWVWRLTIVLPLSFWCMRQVAGVATLPLLKSVQATFWSALGMWLLVRGLLQLVPSHALPILITMTAMAIAGAAAYGALLTLAWPGVWREVRILVRS